MNTSSIHIPVLRDTICTYLQPTYTTLVDGTLGHGGHTIAMLEYMQTHYRTTPQVLGIDTDVQMLHIAQQQTQNYRDHIHYIHDSYAHIVRIVQQYDCLADFILLDIGVNRSHFVDGTRGFSLKFDGPLDMRFDNSRTQTAHDILMEYDLDNLQDMFVRYGDVRPANAHRIAQAIVLHRKQHSLNTTHKLVGLFRTLNLPIKFIAVLFQCIRIQVNQELEQLETFLAQFPDALQSGGRCAIISYHSIEDRLVKYAFKALETENICRILTKKVVAPTRQEVQSNKSARSAKLRVIQKL